MCFSGVIPYGGEEHINKILPRSPGQSREVFVYMFFVFTPPSPQKKRGKRKGGYLHLVANYMSETGRIRFRRARIQALNSVSFFGPHRVPGRELSEFLSAYYLRAKANSPSSRRTHRVCHRVLSSETELSKQYSARFPTFSLRTAGPATVLSHKCNSPLLDKA